MAMICIECDRMVPSNAQFCRYCGTRVRIAKPDQMAPLVTPPSVNRPFSSASSSGRLCGHCGTPTSDVQRFCRRCGVPLAESVAEMEHTLRISRSTRIFHPGSQAATLRLPRYGGMVVIAGAILVMIGCVLPLVKYASTSGAIVPGLVQSSGYFLIFPILALLIAMGGCGGMLGSIRSRTLMSGAVITFSSPAVIVTCGAVIAFHHMLDLLRQMPFVGMLAADIQLGAGLPILALGYLAGFVGGFLIIHNATAN